MPGPLNWSHQQARQKPRRLMEGPHLGFVSSGFVDIDCMTGGFWPGDLILIGGSPCIGKTALALNMAEHAAIEQSLPVSIVSMDMAVEQIAVRLLCSMGRISLDNMRSGRLTEYEGPRLALAIDELAGSSLILEYAPAVELEQLTETVKGFSEKHGKQSLIVVDYLQLILDANRKTSLGPGIAAALRELKKLAIALQCPVIALWQLSSEVETRPGSRPLISDLVPTEAVERYADVVMLIYRDDLYSTTACLEPGVVEVTFPKRRDGSTGVSKLVFLEKMAKYEILVSRN